MTDRELLRLLAVQVTEMCDSVQRWLQQQTRIQRDLHSIRKRLEALEKAERGYTAADERRDMKMVFGENAQ